MTVFVAKDFHYFYHTTMSPDPVQPDRDPTASSQILSRTE
ncbi:hypothetical protein ACVWYY_002797 [Thermostichus sp. MS-CIW-34]